MGLLTAVGIYLTAFCGLGYFVVVLVYGLSSYFVLRLNRWARYFSLLVLTLHMVINLLTINLLYGTGRDSNSTIQLFLEGFDELGFFLEMGLSSILVFLSLIMLLLPGVGEKFRGRNV